MPAQGTGFFRGSGGVVHEMTLPLAEVYADQVTRGQLTRVNPDGSPFTGEADGAAEGAAPSERPAQSAQKSEWVGWAVAQGADPEEAAGMTKADLIEKYGRDAAPPAGDDPKPEDPADPGAGGGE